MTFVESAQNVTPGEISGCPLLSLHASLCVWILTDIWGVAQIPMEEELKYSGRGQHHDSLMGLGSAWSQDDSHIDLNEEQSLIATSIMQLADAQVTADVG